MISSGTVSLICFSAVPWYQEVQGCRATKEGQIEAGASFCLSVPFRSTCCLYATSSCCVYYCVCLWFKKIDAHTQGLQNRCSRYYARVYYLCTLCDKNQKRTPKSRTFCGSRLDPPDTLLLIPTSARGFSKYLGCLRPACAHLGEGVEACKDRASDPRRVLALWGSVDLNLDIFQGQLLDLIQQTVTKTYRERSQ